jgi:hypothetical protein
MGLPIIRDCEFGKHLCRKIGIAPFFVNRWIIAKKLLKHFWQFSSD